MNMCGYLLTQQTVNNMNKKLKNKLYNNLV